MPGGLFAPVESSVVPSTLTRGPWAHGVMHGGAVCGLLGWIVETRLARPDLVCTRLTVEILSGVPPETLELSSEVVKKGRRTAVVDGAIHHGGRMVARASSQWLASSKDGVEGALEDESRIAGLPTARANPAAHADFEYPRPGFNADAVDLRVIEGSTEESGPGRMWIRLDHPLIEGEETSPLQTIATLSDLGAAVGWIESSDGGSFINTDVTLQLLRRPQGQWFLFDSCSEESSEGLACTRSTISDREGHLGWVLQSQMEAPPEIGSGFGSG
jgi:acyl-coenzyme A thioesterase PaaI-like protein